MPLRAVLVPLLLAPVLAAAGCGGDDQVGDRVPASLPELTVPQAGVAPSEGSGDSTTPADTTTTDETTTTDGAAGAGSGAAGAPVTPTPTPTPTQPQSGGGAPAPSTQPQQQAPQSEAPNVGGASPSGGELREFCADNPGAC